MWQRIKPLLVGITASATVFVICLVLYQVVTRNMANERVGQLGIELYFVWALLMLFLPAFAAGYVSKGWGALYGVLLAGVPIALFSMVTEGMPSTCYLMWIAVAAVGGYAGQFVASKRHAS